MKHNLSVRSVSKFSLMLQGCILMLLLFGVQNCLAKVVPAACFTDNMVLQQKTNATLWGTAAPNGKVKIITSWNKQTYTAVTSADGKWKIKVATPTYGGPYQVVFNDGEELVLRNVMIGDVWLCSGQSNMEMQVSGGFGDVLNIQQELADAAKYDAIRMIKIDNKTSFSPQDTVPVKWGWSACNSQTVKEFSAVAYFFAKKIYDEKHIPIGLINDSWGGTVAEAWASGTALKSIPEFNQFVTAIQGGMTQNDIDKQYEKDVRSWIDDINTTDPAYKNGRLDWAQPTFDDHTWPKIKLPAYWEQAGVADYDGTMWFRKVVDVPANWAGKDLILNIAGIDDYDVSFFNGEEVGHKEMFFLSTQLYGAGAFGKSR